MSNIINDWLREQLQDSLIQVEADLKEMRDSLEDCPDNALIKKLYNQGIEIRDSIKSQIESLQ